ncbi:MAG: SAM-dependent methyltransferase [Candidatus Bathyarchaeota archaeon]
MTVDHRTGCLICGEELVYEKETAPIECFYCHQVYDSNAKCKNGHFVCDKCHSLPAMDLIENYCISSKSEDPLELALTLMRNPNIKMHGPEHHFLVPAVLLAAYYNIKKDYKEKATKIRMAKKRATQILGGFCGFYGNCGAAVGTGIFVSLITNATPLSIADWKLANLVTAKSLFVIAHHGGPRCCKRTTFLALLEAADFVKEDFGVSFKTNKELKCEFYPLNNECLKQKCPFYPKRPQ